MRLNRINGAAAFEPLENRRLFAFGETDPTFGDLGRAVTDFGDGAISPVIEDLCVGPAGIVAGGDAGLVRYTASGAVDPTFGVAGKIPFLGALFRASVQDSAGNVFALLVGSGGTVVLKYDAQGLIDRTFGSNGKALVTTAGTFAAKSIAVDGDGKILIAGIRRTSAQGAALVRIYRLDSDGRLDDGFGDDGAAEFQFGQPSLPGFSAIDRVLGIVPIHDGRILVGGGSITVNQDSRSDDFEPPEFPFDGAIFATAQLKSNGHLDDDYGQDGIARAVYSSRETLNDAIDDLGTSGVLPSAFAAAPDGNAVLAANDGELALAEFDTNGQLRFNEHAESGFPLEKPSDAVFLPDGRAAIVGQPRQDQRHGLVMTYLMADGTVGAPVFTDDLIGTTNDLQAQTPGVLAVAPDQHLLIGGTSSDLSGYELVKFSAGPDAAPRSDEFAGGTVNDIAKDADGGLHLAYYDSNSTTLKYAYRAPNGLWTAPVTVDATPNSGGYLSIAVNSHRQPVIAYFAGSTADLNLATSFDTGQTLHFSTW